MYIYTHCSSKFHSNKLKQDFYIRLANYIHPRRYFYTVWKKRKAKEKKQKEKLNDNRQQFVKLKIGTSCETEQNNNQIKNGNEKEIPKQSLSPFIFVACEITFLLFIINLAIYSKL